MRVCFFGGYNPGYIRNVIIKQGLIKNGVEVVECRTKSKFRFWLRYPILFFQHLKFFLVKYDFIFVPAFRHKDVPLAKLIGLLTNKPVVFDPFVSRYETKVVDQKKVPPYSMQGRHNFRIDKWSFKLADIILTDTLAHADYYARKFGIERSKFSRVPVGVPDDFPSLYKIRKEKENRKESNFLVQFYGSFLPLQGIEYIVRAARIIAEKDRAIHFELIGSGQTFPMIRRLVEELKLQNIILRDWIPFKELPEAVSHADVCLGIFGNTEKALRVVPNKVFQCLSLEKPVITGKTPAIVEYFEDRENILLCEVANAHSLAEAIILLKDNEELRRKIARNGYKLIQEKFTSELIGREFKKILTKTLA
ncbi:glycosyltransferase [bacterium]|nr:glycosyltransferase [bacterium]NIN92427.1 glycosyltransferase [bacterium]NIO18541.1 glycosyltransferase [bacterium]NIO73537.1 glycosyltransferase [bacterium]